ncbi:MAG: OmpA family protein [Desulfobacterales bacterium]|nr:OmpA family protein [Desulfobacterales bacterium]
MILRLMMAALILGIFCGSPMPLWALDKEETPLEMDLRLQTDFVESEIIRLQEDHDWLAEKIHRMNTYGRRVPDRMTESLKFKKEKLATLKRLLKRYRSLLRGEKILPSAKASNPVNTTPSKSRIKVRDMPVGKKSIAPKLVGQLAAAGLQDWLEVVGKEGNHVRVENRLPLLFPPGKSEVPNGYMGFLKKLALFIKGHPARVHVEGHADTDPIKTQKYPSNFELGASRAGSVVRHLVQFGVPASAFEIKSRGSQQNINKTSKDWKNLQRHANLIILFKMP